MVRNVIVMAVPVLLLAVVLLGSGSALAATHGSYEATTDACAGCHVAHAAPDPKLLKAGSTQTVLCYLCHGAGTTASPYDVKYGVITGTQTYASTAGGMEKQGGEAGPNVTSRHTVWGYVADANGTAGPWNGDESYKSGLDYIPGGTQTLTGNGLMCSSCHQPHGSSNPRLLRTSLLGTEGLTLQFTMSDVGNNAKRVTAYVSGSSQWCGACHDKFKTLNHNSPPYPGEGHANYYLGMWRHPMDAHPLLPPGSDGSVETGTPLEKPGGVKHIACLTCHRAHATTAQATGYALSWPRDPVAPGSGTTSALLRMDNRGTCYNCHGAGYYNSWNDNRLVAASGGGQIPMDCSKCHPSSNHFSGGGYDCSVCHQ